jgi:hypothetical protein
MTTHLKYFGLGGSLAIFTNYLQKKLKPQKNLKK